MPMISKAAVLHGIPVTIYVKTETAKDEAGAPVYTETAETVENVLVHPATEQEITDTLNLTGRKAVYNLAIPKEDTHDWTNVRVSFFGQDFRTIGAAVQGIDGLVPLEWNKKVRCEVINGKG